MPYHPMLSAIAAAEFALKLCSDASSSSICTNFALLAMLLYICNGWLLSWLLESLVCCNQSHTNGSKATGVHEHDRRQN